MLSIALFWLLFCLIWFNRNSETKPLFQIVPKLVLVPVLVVLKQNYSFEGHPNPDSSNLGSGFIKSWTCKARIQEILNPDSVKPRSGFSKSWIRIQQSLDSDSNKENVDLRHLLEQSVAIFLGAGRS